MELTGWIKIHRKVLETSWYPKLPVRGLALHLILVAHWKESSTIIKRQEKQVEIGQVVTSQRKLALETGLTRQQVRTSLEILHNTGFITHEITHEGSIINIVKYKDYQLKEEKEPNEQPSDNPAITQLQPSDNPRLRSKEVKEVKEVKNRSRDGAKPSAPQSLAVLIYRETFHLNPDHIQQPAIDSAVGDNGQLVTWKEACVAWALSGNNPKNVQGILEWFKTGKRSNYKTPDKKEFGSTIPFLKPRFGKQSQEEAFAAIDRAGELIRNAEKEKLGGKLNGE